MDKPTIDAYNLLAKDYEAKTIDYWSRFPNEFLHSFIQTTQNPVLDLGCGTGRDGAIFTYNKLDVTCLDASEEMVALCKQKHLNAIVGDILSLPFTDEYFGGVWAYTSLLHAKKSEILQALREIYRVLKNQGVLGLGLIAGETEGYTSSYKNTSTSLERWFSYYSEAEVLRLLQESGFDAQIHAPIIDGDRTYMHFLCRKK